MNPCVLVVDDDEAIRSAVGDTLKDEGYRVLCAGDGDEALTLMAGDTLPDLILLDLMMPRRSGWAVLDAITASPRLSSVRVLVLTAFGERADLPSQQPVLHKPMDHEVLLDRVRSMLP